MTLVVWPAVMVATPLVLSFVRPTALRATPPRPLPAYTPTPDGLAAKPYAPSVAPLLASAIPTTPAPPVLEVWPKTPQAPPVDAVAWPHRALPPGSELMPLNAAIPLVVSCVVPEPVNVPSTVIGSPVAACTGLARPMAPAARAPMPPNALPGASGRAGGAGLAVVETVRLLLPTGSVSMRVFVAWGWFLFGVVAFGAGVLYVVSWVSLTLSGS